MVLHDLVYFGLYFLLFLPVLADHVVQSFWVGLLVLVTQYLLDLLPLELSFILFPLVVAVEAPDHKRLRHHILHFLGEVQLAHILQRIEPFHSSLHNCTFTMYSYETAVMSAIVIPLFV